MTDFEKQLEKFMKSKSFKTAVDKAVSSSHAKAIFEDAEKVSEKYAKEMKKALLDEISKLESKRARDRFLNAVTYKVAFEEGTGWVVIINFDESKVVSNSLQPDRYGKAYLPVLFNNGYTAKNYIYGVNNHGEFIRSLKHREPTNFIKNAVEKFNKSNKDIEAEFNKIFGGTLPRNGLAIEYFK